MKVKIASVSIIKNTPATTDEVVNLPTESAPPSTFNPL
jgi:hypothetical protein